MDSTLEEDLLLHDQLHAFARLGDASGVADWLTATTDDEADAGDAKYNRIQRFVDANSITTLPDTYSVGDDNAAEAMLLQSAEEEHCPQESWQFSYDEEADDIFDDHHTGVLAHGNVPAGAASTIAADAAEGCCSCYAASGAAAAAASEDAVVVRLPAAFTDGADLSQQPAECSSSYSTKFWNHSYDEEAEGPLSSFAMVATGPQFSSALDGKLYRRALRAERRAHLLDEGRTNMGDLERMEAWIDPSSSNMAAAAAAQRDPVKYGRILNFVEANAVRPLTGRMEHIFVRLAERQDYRRPQQWALTFDEDAHGSFDEGALGSA